MSNSKRIVGGSAALARAFATVGLLRLVKSTTPPDLVCVYTIQTSQPYGLRSHINNISWSKSDRSGWTPTILRANESSRPISFPPGLVKMAKDYLTRMFWRNVKGLIRFATVRETRYSYGLPYVPTYPKAICDVLSHIRVHSNSILWDARNAIVDLHAVATPTMLDAPSWKEGRRSYDKSQFFPLQQNQVSNLNALQCVLDNYNWNSGNELSIPNEAEKKLLLDLIECFLMMNCEDYPVAFRLRQAYEYARIGNAFGHDGMSKSMRDSWTFKSYQIRDGIYESEAFISGIMERLKYTSPEAAICMTVLSGNNPVYEIPGFSAAHVGAPINEVMAYLAAEINVERIKRDVVLRTIEDIKDGKYTGSCGCDPYCEEVPCEASSAY